MTAPTEHDFDLQILKAGDRYRAYVLQSQAGEASGEFSVPFSDEHLGSLFRGLGHVRRSTRGGSSPEATAARDFGAQLFDSVFSGHIRDCLNDSRGRAKAAKANLRIRLRLTDVPELLDLPWELLFDKRRGHFVTLDGSTTLVRHLPVPQLVGPMHVQSPLRVLVAISNPRGDLNVEQEWSKLANALEPLTKRGLVELRRLQPATFDGLQTALADDSIHVLHFVGHGYYDVTSQSGSLLFEAAAGGERKVGAARLADLLRPRQALRLVVLNACEGGRSSRQDTFAGVAQALVQNAIPGVVAMQFPVTDEAAVTFAGAFYKKLADGSPVDLALGFARQEVSFGGEEGDIEWATPVLYMRGDGRLFDVATGTSRKLRGLGAFPVRWAAGLAALASVLGLIAWLPPGEGEQRDERSEVPVAVSRCAGYESRDRTEICLLQHVVGQRVDGKFGPATCDALKEAWHTRLGFPGQPPFIGLINDDLMAAVKRSVGLPSNAGRAVINAKLADLRIECGGRTTSNTVAGTPITLPAGPAACTPIAPEHRCRVEGARCAFECELSQVEIRRIRARLASYKPGLSTTADGFDDDLRMAIATFQRQQGLTNQSGVYTQETASALPSPLSTGAASSTSCPFLPLVKELSTIHGFQDSQTWRLTRGGIEVDGRVSRTAGAPVATSRVWTAYRDQITAAAEKYKVPAELLLADILTESSGKPDAIRLEPGYVSDEATPHRASVGLTQLFISTAREVMRDPGIDRKWLLQPENAINAGAAFLAAQSPKTDYDPPKVAAAKNAGRLVYEQTPNNRWRMRTYPIGTGQQIDRYVAWFGDAITVIRETGPLPAQSFAACPLP